MNTTLICPFCLPTLPFPFVVNRNQPVHLYDAYTGSVRASYRPYNALDEMESAVVACFHPSGTQLVASGFRSDRTLHVFDTAVPGRESTVWRLGKTRRSSDGQKGLVSSLAYAPDGKYVAVGTYAPASIYVYDHRSGSTPSGTVLDGTCVVGHGRSHARKKRRLAAVSDPADPEDEDDAPPTWLSSAKVKWFHKKAQGGITHLQFSPTQEYLLYSVSRRSNTVLTWDLRMLSDDPDCKSHAIGGIASYETDNDTNQRLEFDLDDTGSRLFVGGRDRCVRVYSTESGELQGRIGGLDGPASGVSIRRNPSSASGSSFLAIASGARRFLSEEELDGEDAALPSNGPPGALRLFQVGDGSSGDIDDNSSPLDNSDEGRLDCAQ